MKINTTPEETYITLSTGGRTVTDAAMVTESTGEVLAMLGVGSGDHSC